MQGILKESPHCAAKRIQGSVHGCQFYTLVCCSDRYCTFGRSLHNCFICCIWRMPHANIQQYSSKNKVSNCLDNIVRNVKYSINQYCNYYLIKLAADLVSISINFFICWIYSIYNNIGPLGYALVSTLAGILFLDSNPIKLSLKGFASS